MANGRSHSSRSTLSSGFVVAGRYRVERMLGRGGSATVYCAIDDHSGAEVALKHLLADAGSAQHVLFQREYHTLAQITHPGVIRVFEYGVTSDGPFYTMELLDGQDLSELAPLAWAEACRVLREVASALAMLHSRRLIHRDVSHRNVRVTSDGRAKLIDFGAMAPMGFVPDVIGTPPFLSPEAADGELLDQRTDLYALGALAHWLLTGRHLYPAKSVRALRELWADAAASAPAFPADVPAALQQLVIGLLQRDAMARPSSAAEVIDRLIAIAGLPAADEASIARSYLTNPKLIGRQSALQLLEAELARALGAGRSVALIIRGSYGTGKSRLLQEAVIQAKFAGFTVLQAAAHAGEHEPYAVIARIVEELLHKLPHVAAQLAPERRQVLSRVIHGLRADRDTQPIARPMPAQELRAQVQVELSSWLLELGAHERLLLAIDDLHACDDESLAVLLEVSAEGGPGPAILAALRDLGAASSPGVRLLTSRAARAVELRPLSAAETERLVESLFGSSPSSQRVAGWMQEHARGNPLECMELARRLVEQRAAHYMDGAWMLPSELPAGLPRGLADAFRARVAALEPAQRALAELLALYDKPAPLSLCIELSGAADEAELFFALNQLVSEELLFVRGDRYAISREALREALLQRLSPERRTELHQRIGDTLSARGLGDALAQFEAGYHTMRGRERMRGVQLVEQAVADESALAELGEAVIPALQLAVELCDESGAAPGRAMRLRVRLSGCAFAYDKKLISYADPLFDQLLADSGLSFWSNLEPGSGAARLERALQLAQQEYDRTPPERRGLAPLEALLELGAVVGAALGVAIYGYDVAKVDRLAQIVVPLADLEKQYGIAVIYDLVTMIQTLMHGRLGRAHALRSELLARLRDPSCYLGITDDRRNTILATQLHAMGMRQAVHHSGRALAIAEEIDALGMKAFVGAALQIRLLTHLYRGDAEAANACQLRLDSVSLQGGAGRQNELWLLGYLVGPYSLWGDVIALKRTAERFAALVADNPGYRAQLYTALGAYYRERGQLDESKRALEHALRLSGPHLFGPWVVAMGQYIETLVAAGEGARAIELANAHFGPGEPEGDDRAVFLQQVLGALALAEARLGAVEAAAHKLDAGIAQAQAEDKPLVWRAKLHEARARVAIEARDPAAFEEHAERAAELYRSVNNSVLLLKHLTLLDEGARFGVTKRGALARERDRVDASTSMPTVQERHAVTAHELVACADDGERFEHVLALILDGGRARAGMLLSAGPDALRVLAKSAGEPVPDGLLEAASALGARTETELERTVQGELWSAATGERYQLLALSGAGSRGPAVAGIAALRLEPEAAPHSPSAALLGAIARALQEAAELSTGRPFEAWMAL